MTFDQLIIVLIVKVVSLEVLTQHGILVVLL